MCRRYEEGKYAGWTRTSTKSGYDKQKKKCGNGEVAPSKGKKRLLTSGKK